MSGLTVKNPLAKPTLEVHIDQIEHGLRNVLILRAFFQFLCVFITIKMFISNESYAFSSVNHYFIREKTLNVK